VYDFRHTFASHLVSHGASLPLIGKLMGHTQPGTTQRYAHIADSALRAVTNDFSKVIEMPKPRNVTNEVQRAGAKEDERKALAGD
jgi:site-specific recombinase XerC